MNINIFEQFISPEIILIPIAPLSILIPIFLLPYESKLLGNRITSTIIWTLKLFSLNITNQLPLKGQKWSRLLVSLFILILSSNLLGLLPYTFTSTSQLSINIALAIPLWLATIITGIKNKPSISLAHLLPEGSPTPLIPFIVIIETVSLLIRPMALGVRLTANITAGHLLISIVSSASINFITSYTSISLLTLILLFLLIILELAVACIQAYVFTLLVILYLEENS